MINPNCYYSPVVNCNVVFGDTTTYGVRVLGSSFLFNFGGHGGVGVLGIPVCILFSFTRVFDSSLT
jgi:hypothetical protein